MMMMMMMMMMMIMMMMMMMNMVLCLYKLLNFVWIRVTAVLLGITSNALVPKFLIHSYQNLWKRQTGLGPQHCMQYLETSISTII